MRETMMLLFLCTGNSCRSQMAEGFARARADDGVRVVSGGIETHGLNPRAVRAMAEVGIDISGQSSDIFAPETVAVGDLVVTVCDHAREACLVLPSTVRQLHWSFDDPARATGSEAEMTAVFRRVRDEIGRRVKGLFEVVPMGGASGDGTG